MKKAVKIDLYVSMINLNILNKIWKHGKKIINDIQIYYEVILQQRLKDISSSVCFLLNYKVAYDDKDVKLST